MSTGKHRNLSNTTNGVLTAELHVPGYVVADAATRALISDQVQGDDCLQLDTMLTYRYSGAAWVLSGGGITGSGSAGAVAYWTSASVLAATPLTYAAGVFTFPGNIKIPYNRGILDQGSNFIVGVGDVLPPFTNTVMLGSTALPTYIRGTNCVIACSESPGTGDLVIDVDIGTEFSVLNQATTGGRAFRVRDRAGSPLTYLECLISTTLGNKGLTFSNGMGLYGIAGYSETPTSNSTTPYTVLSTDNHIYEDATAGNLVVNLPVATGSGRIITIKKIDSSANTVTVTADTSGTPDTIDGAATFVLSVQYESITIQDAATNVWYVN